MKQPSKNRILILGASGFIGKSLYKELQSYFDTYGTYCSNVAEYASNHAYFRYCVEEDELASILEKVKPSVVISALRGDFKEQLKAHSVLAKYVQEHHFCKLLFLSSANVFDGKFDLPSYESDKPLAESRYGKFKIAVERMLSEQIPAQTTILRLPIVLGVQSPRIAQLRQSIKHKASFEVFPNLTISLTTADKIAQQVHYIISKKLDGIYHLASTDMVHHEDLFREITSKLGDKTPIFKSVYRSNDDSYLAILQKKNKLPQQYRITVAEVIDDCTLKEEIITLKNQL
ncbi:sugar nucleotide-binding protein [Ulvibacter antarcticus]|uniref:dTDP-4-dehydrorhamnose reductase n=1 Tax=Ulvibacter antarcticus TaxID=442714 RepID=A0A3L9YV58_9FLAO|nr:sugar nucleotide-binding protein [Ulvibacter antarcticus]RMA64204.1 dTDP-4-dehydrorhamnose reductase [Ulvibacter antarcticus]